MQDWVVLPALNRLRGKGQEVHLEPKVMEVLVYLIEAEGKVVSKEEIIGSLWPQVFVTDDVLTRSIGLLRKALDDDPKNPQFIETIPKSGYRLLVSACPVSAGLGF
jgi:DNA-binding winged helix-turn-helix (wHTH) protein